jgi:hypothetical protein
MQILEEPGFTSEHELLLMEEALAIEHGKRMKAERTLQSIAQSKQASAEQLRRLAIEHLEAA